ncbi:hypothetical protein BCY86_07375 [Pajaroellobacter abortibovis]|uniref:ABC transporter domain-containing protein n=1 Tax=Pajaroellobacter abortibovis TaxID=1882918 RepID=A0A1L6MZF6_9BACT|nr:hypothetical protein BCY86_07375 [Pajaroellobacter abortibovis]
MLAINNLTKSFPQTFDPVLQQLDLELEQGEFCVLIGNNGSGKSTLFKLIMGEHKADSGSILIAGEEITHKPVHQRVKLMSSVTQDITKGTVQEMTLLENVLLSLMRGGESRFRFYHVYAEQVKREIERLGMNLEASLHCSMSSLSGGQRQMIATLMALLSKPFLLLLDEYTSALDPKAQKRLMEYTAQQIRQHHITTIMITHKLEEALQYGDRLVMLHQGKIVFDVEGEEKAKLTIHQLLNLFHQYEDRLFANEPIEVAGC